MTASKIVDATIEITSLGEPLLETHAETLLALSMSPNPVRREDIYENSRTRREIGERSVAYANRQSASR